MKTPFKKSYPIAGLVLLACSGIALATESSNSEIPPKGLAASDWSSIRAAYEAGRHVVHRQENGTLTARNPGQQWRTEFDGKGFTVTPDHGQWTWGLELTAYGGRTLSSASSSVTHDGGKITCQRDENLTEWFINDTRGLEQGWTISSRSVGSLPAIAESDGRVSPPSENLTLTLALRGNLQAQVSPDSSSVAFQTASGGTALTYGGLKAWDADGKNLLVRFEPAGENAIRIAVEDQSARYPITIDPVAQQAYLKASNTNFGHNFGYSVAVSGDTAVVSAPFERSNTTGVNGDQTNNSASSSGAAYVFTRIGTAWSQQAYLKASNTGANDLFGISVAVSGDTLVIGASGESSSTSGVNSTPNESGDRTGAAYVFTRIGTTWSQQAYLKASNPGALDRFGNAVAVSGDIVAVGSPYEDSSSSGVNSTPNETAGDSGAVYIFSRSGTTWSQQAYLKAADNGDIAPFGYWGSFNEFGYSVAVSGNTVVVGAYKETSGTTGVNSTPIHNANDAGAAYVFTRNGATWSQQAYLKASNTGAGDQFGYSVAVSGDTLVVGAQYEDSSTTGVNSTPNENAIYSGAAYVFTRSGTVWSQQAYLKASNTRQLDSFGCSVAIAGDKVVVGASGEDSSRTGVNSTPFYDSSFAGAAYVFSRTGSTWGQQAYLKASNTGQDDWFGHSVAVAGDIVVVGAPYEDSIATGINGDQMDNSANDSGAAYVFDLNAVLPVPEIAIQQAGSDIAISTTKAFGSIFTGSNSELIFTILNTGTSDLTLTGTPKVAVSGSPDFSVTAQPASPINGPSGSTTFTVRFAPTSGGSKTASLSIPNNDSDENPFVINLTGTGVIPPSTNADMGSLFVREGSGISGPLLDLEPAFSPAVTSYQVTVPQDSTVVNITGLVADPSATIGLGPSGFLNTIHYIGSGDPLAFSFSVMAEDRFTFKIYTVNFVRQTASEIAIEQAGSDISADSTKAFGPVPSGSTSDLSFTILNTGNADLTLTGTPKVAVTGSPDFTVTAQPSSPIIPSGSSDFTVRFTPTGSGLKEASLSVASNDDDENPFVVNLTGTALSFSIDGDNDGLSDASEYNMAALGFNWQVDQSALVDTLFTNAAGAGLFTTHQVQALNTGTPLIARDPATGKFKLTMDWKKSTNLTNFLDFPAPAGSAVSISPQGDVEYEFPSADDAAFYRIEVADP